MGSLGKRRESPHLGASRSRNAVSTVRSPARFPDLSLSERSAPRAEQQVDDPAHGRLRRRSSARCGRGRPGRRSPAPASSRRCTTLTASASGAASSGPAGPHQQREIVRIAGVDVDMPRQQQLDDVEPRRRRRRRRSAVLPVLSAFAIGARRAPATLRRLRHCP